MKNSTTEFSPVLRQFERTIRCANPHLEEAPAGLSGARVWRFRTSIGEWALRRWPEGYRADRLRWIDKVLRAVPHSIPLAIPSHTDDDRPFVDTGMHLWSIEPWMPGKADFWQEPRPEKLAAAMETLASFHRAVSPRGSTPQLVPALLDRIAALKQHIHSLDEYRRAAANSHHLLSGICAEILHIAADELRPWQCKLAEHADTRTMLVPCLRDIWHDHVLFTQNRVSGIIDHGAMRLDSIATDIARLLGSLIGDDAASWKFALDAYRRAGILAESDAKLIGPIDGSSQVITGLNWVRWICLENRAFENDALVRDRLNRVLTRLRNPRTIIN